MFCGLGCAYGAASLTLASAVHFFRIRNGYNASTVAHAHARGGLVSARLDPHYNGNECISRPHRVYFFEGKRAALTGAASQCIPTPQQQRVHLCVLYVRIDHAGKYDGAPFVVDWVSLGVLLVASVPLMSDEIENACISSVLGGRVGKGLGVIARVQRSSHNIGSRIASAMDSLLATAY